MLQYTVTKWTHYFRQNNELRCEAASEVCYQDFCEFPKEAIHPALHESSDAITKYCFALSSQIRRIKA